MKLIELNNAKKVFSTHLQERIPTQTAYKIFKIVKTAEDNSEFYIAKVNSLLEECGEKNEDGTLKVDNNGSVKILNDKLNIWQKGIAEIDNLEIDTPDYTFTLEELSPIKLSVQDIINIQNLIKEQ